MINVHNYNIHHNVMPKKAVNLSYYTTNLRSVNQFITAVYIKLSMLMGLVRQSIDTPYLETNDVRIVNK